MSAPNAETIAILEKAEALIAQGRMRLKKRVRCWEMAGACRQMRSGRH